MGGKATRDTQGIIRFFFLRLKMYTGENIRWKILRINSLYWCSNFLSEKILFFNRHVIGQWIGEGNGTLLQYSCLENPMDGGAWKAASMGSLRVGHDWATSLSLFTVMHWEGNGNPLQCSYLENPRDGGAWCAAIYGVAQSWTRLKWLGSSSSSRGVDKCPC